MQLENQPKRSLPSCLISQSDSISGRTKQRRLQKMSSDTTPSDTAASVQQSFEGYFEKQTPFKALCGLHALNNAIGGGFFSQEDMSRACTDFLREATREGLYENREDHEYTNTGWYSEALMAYVVNWKIAQNALGNFEGGQMLFDLNNPVRAESHASLRRIYDLNVHGIIVNQTQTHWTAIRYVNHNIWLLDSLKEPTMLTWEAYTAYIAQYHNAFALCDNAST